MALKLTKALSDFKLADTVDLDCGSFDIVIKPAAIHNESFRAAISERSLKNKKQNLAPNKSSLTGSHEEDVKLFIEHILVGWGTRPLYDDEGAMVPFTPDNLMEIFTSTVEGKVLFGKIQTAAVDDQLFVVNEEDLKNS